MKYLKSNKIKTVLNLSYDRFALSALLRFMTFFSSILFYGDLFLLLTLEELS